MSAWLIISTVSVIVGVGAAVGLLVRRPDEMDLEDAGSTGACDERGTTALHLDAVPAALPAAVAAPMAGAEIPGAEDAGVPARRLAAAAPPGPAPGSVPVALATHPVAAVIATRVAAGTLSLPRFPRSAERVLACCSDPACAPDELADAVQLDPTLTAHVLGVASSSAYAPETPATSLELALMGLGLQTVKDIAVAVTLRERLFRGADGDEHAQFLLRHSVMTSAFAREAARVVRVDPDLAALAGLLHDIGRPTVRMACGEAQAELGAELEDETLYAIVREHHPAAGGQLAANLRLPRAVCNAIARHHGDPLDPRKDRLGLVVRLADELALWARHERDDPLDASTLRPLQRALELAPVDLDRLLLFRSRARQLADAYLR